MPEIADDIAYLVSVIAGDMLSVLLALLILFTLVLAVRDGFTARDQT